MLRVLTLSTLFPNARQPTLGVFVERQTLGLAARDDVEVEVVAPVGLPIWPLSSHQHYRAARSLPLNETWKGLTVHRPRFRTWPGPGQRRMAASMAAALLPWLRRLRQSFPFDVIDAEFFWPDGPAAVRLAEALGVACSIKARGSDIHYWGKRPGIGSQIAEAGKRANGLLAVSEALKRDMAALGMPEAKIAVHRTGIDLDRFLPVDRTAAKAVLGLRGPVLVTAGALIPRKGQSFAIEALRHIPEATLLLIGDGPDRTALEGLARRQGLQGRVRFLGSLAHEELPALLAAADVAVQPSAFEGIANVWVEALACGTPVVTCEVGGAREVIDGGEAGRLVPREPEVIAAAVRDILAEPPSQDAVRRAAEGFSWDKNSAELFDHLRSLASPSSQSLS